jgi:hypothetical protein
MSTEPSTGQNDSGLETAPQVDEKAVDLAASTAAAKAAEASKLFDKLFAKNEPTSTVNTPKEIPPPIRHEPETGETFVRKVVHESEDHNFQRVVKTSEEGTFQLPDRLAETQSEVAEVTPLRKVDNVSQPKTQLVAQVIPTAVDTVVSDPVRAEIQAKVQLTKYAAKPEINFPARVNNLKTQNEQLRARLESLE